MPKKQLQRIIDTRRAIGTATYGVIGAIGGGGSLITEDRFHKYATTVVAAVDSYHPEKDYADYICDGVGDEEEINLAILAGGRVVLLDGTYTIGESILMAHDVELTGSGPGKCSIRNTASTPTLYSATLVNHFGVRDMRLDCVQPAAADFLVQAPMLRCYFARVTFSSALDTCVQSDDAERLRFFDCEFRDCVNGIKCIESDEVDIHKCRFYRCLGTAVQFTGPVRCSITESTFFYCNNGITLGVSEV